MKLLNGLETAFSGTITIDGLNVKNTNSLGKVGFVFQNPDNQIVFPIVQEDLAFGLKKSGLSKNQIAAKIDTYLHIFKLTDLSERRTHELSGGEKQIIALIGVLIMEPDIIVLDEPTTVLDLRNRYRLIQRLKQLKQSLIIVSHDLDLMATMDRLIWIDNGTIKNDGSPETILEKYKKFSESA